MRRYNIIKICRKFRGAAGNLLDGIIIRMTESRCCNISHSQKKQRLKESSALV